MLTGQYNHTVDSKGRVFIPAKFRADLGQQVTVSIIFGKYICVYADSEWEKFIEKLGEKFNIREIVEVGEKTEKKDRIRKV